MNNKSLDDIKIDQSKFKADGQKYFSLFEKHIPRNMGAESNVLLYSLNNEDCIMNIVALNPEARYFVYDHEHLKYLKEISPQTRFVFMHDDGSDKVGAFKNMFCQLSSKYNIDMKFDCIIMNPPYQNILHLKILTEAISHLKDDKSVCVNLSPIHWLSKHSYFSSKYLMYRNKLNGYIKHIETFNHRVSNELFNLGNQIESLGISILTTKNDSTAIDLLKYGFINDKEFNLITKILKPRDGKLVWRNNTFTKFHSKPTEHEVCINQWSSGETCYDACIQKNNKRVLVAHFNTANERENFLNSLKTTFMEWYYQTIIKVGENKIHIYGFMLDDYTKPWTNERFYKFFNITEDEQKIIEETMAKYK